MKKIFLLTACTLAISVVITGCSSNLTQLSRELPRSDKGSAQEQVSSNDMKSTYEKADSKAASADESALEIKELLTSNDWWNNIQYTTVFKFNEDGTWYTPVYEIDSKGNPKVTSDERSSDGDYGTYRISGNDLVLTGESGSEWTAEISYTDTEKIFSQVADKSEWNMVKSILENYSYSGALFYELDYQTPSNGEPDNAFWMIPYSKDEQSIDNDLSVEERYIEFINSGEYEKYNVQGITFRQYAMIDLNDDGTEELILKEFNEQGEQRGGDGFSMIFSYDESSNAIRRIDCAGNAGNVYQGNGLFCAYYGPTYQTENGLIWTSGEGHGTYYYQFDGENMIWVKDEYIDYEGSERVYIREDGQTGEKEYITREDYAHNDRSISLDWETIS